MKKVTYVSKRELIIGITLTVIFFGGTIWALFFSAYNDDPEVSYRKCCPMTYFSNPFLEHDCDDCPVCISNPCHPECCE